MPLMFAFRNAHPEDMIAILHTLNAYPDLSNNQEIRDKVKELGFTIIDYEKLNALITARDLFLVHKSKNVLTEKGNLIVQILEKKESLFMEILHYLLYSTWNPNVDRKENCLSWTYRNLCRILWNMVTLSIDIDTRRHFASQLADKAKSEFIEDIEKKDGIQDVSINRLSISNILRWIKKLEPSCLSESGKRELSFTRRPFCPPELMIMVIDFLYREKGIPYASNMLLTEENIDELCCACLLDPDAFEEVLNWTTRQFDFLKSSIAGGGWGRHLTLMRKPELTDLI